MATLGPGATNLMTPGAYAQLGAMPMVMITGQKPIKTSKQARFQILDVVDMLQPITKFTKQIVNGNTIPSLVRESFRLATEERPGAVHLELPEDIAREEAGSHLFEVVGHRRPDADEKAILKAAEMIESAEKPLLMIGAGANRKDTREALTEFINSTGIYFFCTQMGKGVIDERHPQYLGTAALSDHDFVHRAIDESDLVINVGHDAVEKPPFFMHEGGKKVIHLNFFPAEVDAVYFPQLNVVGDIRTSVLHICRHISGETEWETGFFRQIKEDVESHLTKYFKDTRFPMLPQRLVSIMRDTLADEDIITLDNGVYKIWFARNYKCYEPNTLLLDNALATMGAGLPSAMLAKLISPGKNVVAVCGDGGFMMNSQELETAVRNNLDIVVIIVHDNSYGMIKWKQEDMGFDNFGLDFGNPDFVTYAESYGASGHRPESDEEFREMLSSSLGSGGVHVIDLQIDYSLNHSILNVLIKEKTEAL